MTKKVGLSYYLKQEKLETQNSLKYFLAERKQIAKKTTKEFLQMTEWLCAYSVTGGKWIRPLLTRLAFGISGGMGEESELYKASAVVELFHRFILIHDDIMDQDQLRHGKPTVEQLYRLKINADLNMIKDNYYPQGMAMVAGDILHTWTYELLLNCKFSENIRIKTLRALNSCLEFTAAGWALETDLKHTHLKQVSETSILEAMKLVSAHYSVVWPLRIGQVLAGKDKWNVNLEDYGFNVGMAFQIQDDVLALMGDSEVMGKPVGSDLKEGKKSLLIYLTYSRATQTEKAFIESLMNQEISSKELDKVREIITRTGALNEVNKRAKNYIDHAFESLEKIPDSEYKSRLFELAEFLVKRDY